MQVNSDRLHEKIITDNKSLIVRVSHYNKESAGNIMPSHIHIFTEIIYIIQGEMIFMCGDNRSTVKKGNIIVVNENENHSFECIKAPLELYCILIDLSSFRDRFFYLSDVEYIKPILQNCVLFNNILKNDIHTAFFIKRIVQEYINQQTGYELAVKSYTFDLILSLYRNHLKKIKSLNEVKCLDLNSNKMNIILDYIDKNYMDELSIDELADMINISKNYFCRLFKKLNGKTVTDYINHKRINEAYSLLKETDMKISEVALTVGFNEINYFSRVFRTVMGMPPTEIKKANIMQTKLYKEELIGRFELFFSASPLPTFITRLNDGTIEIANKSFFELFGYTPDETVGETVDKLDFYVDKKQRIRLIEILRTTGLSSDIEILFKKKSGEQFLMLTTAKTFSIDNELFIFIIGQDITERKAMENALKETQARLDFI